MISKILVPTDGSKMAQKAARYAVELAEKTGAAIVFMGVIDTRFIVSRSVPAAASPTHLIDPMDDYLRQAAEAYLNELEELCRRNNVRSKTAIRSGHPVDEIIKEARRSKADLIIMGSLGKSALKAAFLGSVSFGVIQSDLKIPVMLVKS